MKINKYLVGLATAALGLTANVNAQQSPEQVNIHGSACQAANLGQAINFQTSWSQNGIANPNALGSGRSFFVVCPVPITDDETVVPDADLGVHLVYSDHDGVNDVSCFARRYRDGEVLNQVNNTDNQNAGFTGDQQMQFPDVIRDSDADFNGFNDFQVIVCALPPQATIQGVFMDFD